MRELAQKSTFMWVILSFLGSTRVITEP